jgi:hypothetical protein
VARMSVARSVWAERSDVSTPVDLADFRALGLYVPRPPSAGFGPRASGLIVASRPFASDPTTNLEVDHLPVRHAEDVWRIPLDPARGGTYELPTWALMLSDAICWMVGSDDTILAATERWEMLWLIDVGR